MFLLLPLRGRRDVPPSPASREKVPKADEGLLAEAALTPTLSR